jgi:hypothetical protein
VALFPSGFVRDLRPISSVANSESWYANIRRGGPIWEKAYRKPRLTEPQGDGSIPKSSISVGRNSRNDAQPSAVTLVHTSLTIAAAARHRDAAIHNMVTAIAGQDFPKARQYSYREIRLMDLQNEVSTGHRDTA